MVDEILKVEPQLLGAQVQHTPIARKMELWQTIVNKVNAVGHHPRTSNDIRKRWNNLRGKFRSMASRHHIVVQKTGGGPPPAPPAYTDWEGKVLAIRHPEGLTAGMDSGQQPPEEDTLACHRQGSAGPGGLQPTEHPLQEEVGGPAVLGEEDLRGPAGEVLPARKGCPSGIDPPYAMHPGSGVPRPGWALEGCTAVTRG
ncbi:hypothetical protein NDU88_001470 [Pleurodeles waltl]|uniref:Myb/SANT-like DNA-binding domain-containing protein n=1 Tax=Pleurodeles waltl TaxID=8319 RepID=A0AAV7V7V9_PLEWA|nr:hypothetical protein NDU88_001470 [Pleurodeles waltl]